MKIFGKGFKLFNYSLDGKGVRNEPEGPKNLKNFFKSYFRKFNRLITVNIFMVLGNFPIFFALLALSGNLNNHFQVPSNPAYTVIDGVMPNAAATNSSALAALDGVFGSFGDLSMPTLATNIFFILSVLFILTFGLVNVGTTYILRNMVKGEPIFMWSDFWYAIKRNLRQGLILGVLDILFTVIIAYDILFFYMNIGGFAANMAFWLSLFLALLYIFMRYYMYIIMITFDLSIFKILKNSLIFALLGIKRNIMALLGTVFALFITVGLFSVFVPLGIIIPFIILFSTCSYMGTYAAFPKIKQYMIDPYYVEEKNDDEDPIFKDRG